MSYESVPRWIREIPEHFKTQEMCNEIVGQFSYALRYVPNHLKTQEMCSQAVRNNRAVFFVPDWFDQQLELVRMLIGQQQLDVGHDDDYWYHDDDIIEWYESYKKRKAQKISIKKELLPIAWHPSIWWDWCMSEDQKKETEKLWK